VEHRRSDVEVWIRDGCIGFGGKGTSKASQNKAVDAVACLQTKRQHAASYTEAGEVDVIFSSTPRHLMKDTCNMI